MKNNLEEKENAKEETKLAELVFVLVNGEAQQKEIKTGIQDNDFIEIKSGLNKGEEIISGPYSAVSKILKNGTKVKVVKKEDLYKSEK